MLNIPGAIKVLTFLSSCASNVEEGQLHYNDHHLNQSLELRLSQQRDGRDSVRECGNVQLSDM